MTSTSKVSITILNWNGFNNTIDCLESLVEVSPVSGNEET